MPVPYVAADGLRYHIQPIPMTYLAIMRKMKRDKLALTRLILAGGIVPPPSNEAISSMLENQQGIAVELITQIVDMTTDVKQRS